jgi:hypothetical protein
MKAEYWAENPQSPFNFLHQWMHTIRYHPLSLSIFMVLVVVCLGLIGTVYRYYRLKGERVKYIQSIWVQKNALAHAD